MIESTVAPLSSKDCLKCVLRFMIPYSLNELIVNGEFFFRALMFSKLGGDVLAASNLITITQLVTIATAKAMLISTNIYVARNVGSTSRLAGILQQSWQQAILQSIPLLLVLSFTRPIFLVFKQNEDVANIAANYLQWSNLGLFSTLFLHCNQMFAVGLKRPKLALLTTIFSALVSLGLSYLFAFGLGVLPALGIKGVAIGSAVASWLSFGFMTGYLVRYDGQIREFSLLNWRGEKDRSMLWNMLKTGLPLGLDSLSGFASFFLMSMMLGRLGTNFSSAEQIVNQYGSLLMAPIMATAMAVDVLVGRDITACSAQNIKRLTCVGLGVGCSIAMAGLVLVSSFSLRLSQLFLDRDDVQYEDMLTILPSLFFIVGILNLTEALRFISSAALRGFYDTTAPMLITASLFWVVALPISYLLAFPLQLGAQGVFIGRVLGSLGAAVFIYKRWFLKSSVPEASVREGQVGYSCAGVVGIFSRFSRGSEGDNAVSTYSTVPLVV